MEGVLLMFSKFDVSGLNDSEKCNGSPLQLWFFYPHFGYLTDVKSSSLRPTRDPSSPRIVPTNPVPIIYRTLPVPPIGAPIFPPLILASSLSIVHAATATATAAVVSFLHICIAPQAGHQRFLQGGVHLLPWWRRHRRGRAAGLRRRHHRNTSG